MRIRYRLRMNKLWANSIRSGLLAISLLGMQFNPLTCNHVWGQAGRGTAPNLQGQRRAVLVDIEEEVREQNPLQERNQFQLTREQLDYWIFNNPYELARDNQRALVELEIVQLESVCELSPEQKRILQIAAAGELQRLVSVRKVLQSRYADRTYKQNKIGKVYQELQAYQKLLVRRSFDSKSLVLKSLPSILDPSQRARFAAWQEERQRAEQRAQIDAALAEIEKQVPLTIAQREQLIGLIESHTRPVAAPAENNIQPGIGRLAQLNGVSPELFQAFLQPPQWETLQTIILARRGLQRMLRDNQLLLAPPQEAAVPNAVVEPAAADVLVQEAAQ
jgi:hypothetical protein